MLRNMKKKSFIVHINQWIVPFVFFFIFFSTIWGDQKNEEVYSQENATKYAEFGITGTSWLSFRDIHLLIQTYVNGGKTLDFGCGSGRSTRFLKDLGLNIVGVDISKTFLDEANNIDTKTHYFQIKDQIPSVEKSYDFVYSHLVLLMVPTKENLDAIFKEIYRVLRKGGVFIAVTGSEEMHSSKRNWVSYDTRFQENIMPSSGSRVKLVIKDVGATFYDYYWTNTDYLELITQNGFKLLETHYPIGKEGEGYEWFSEKEFSPYVVYVMQKL